MTDAPQQGGIAEFLNLLQGVNPLAGIQRSIAQFQQGVDGFLRTVDNLNDTLEQLNGTAQRVNGLLDTVEGPIRAFVPQIQRTIEAADAMVDSMSGSFGRVGPGLTRLADTLTSAPLINLSEDVGEFLTALGDFARRMQPLAQLAESAGSMFGLRALGGLLQGGPRQTSAPAKPAPVIDVSPRPSRRAAEKAPARKAPAKKAAKRSAAKRPPRV